jgi:D-3-phosphoglycerate dehydrogenase
MPTKVALVDLDGHRCPDWVIEQLTQAGIELMVRQCNTKDEMAAHAADAEIVWLFGGNRVLHGGTFEVLPKCRAVVRTGSGTDNVPVDEATKRGIVVSNTPAVMADAVADHTITLLLSVVRKFPMLDRLMREGVFDQHLGRPLNTLQGKTFGLVGFGHIARQVLHKMRGFDMRWLVHDPFVSADTVAAHGAEPAALDTLMSESDFVSLHTPITSGTRKLIGEPQLRQMKRTAVLINAARGPVVDEAALIRALQEGWIAGAGLDCFEEEPPALDNPLLKMENVVLTPHSASQTAAGFEPRWHASVDSVLKLAEHKWPASCVNREVKPARPLT